MLELLVEIEDLDELEVVRVEMVDEVVLVELVADVGFVVLVLLEDVVLVVEDGPVPEFALLTKPTNVLQSDPSEL